MRTENPLGLMGYYLVGDGKKEPYRLKMRTASFSNVSVIPAMLPGTLVPDLIAILGLDLLRGRRRRPLGSRGPALVCGHRHSVEEPPPPSELAD